MEKNKEIKGMFDGPMLPLVTKLALPVLAGMVFNLLYNITDTIFVSRIDPSDPSIVGGTGIVFPILFFTMALASGLMVGTSSLVARGIGEKKYEAIDRAAESGLFVAVILSAVIILAGYFFMTPMLRMLNATGDFMKNAREYMIYILPAAFIMFVSHVLLGLLQGTGQMKYIMHSMIIGTVGNIILDPIFIFPLGLGVGGAALATTVAQAIAMVYLIYIFLSKKAHIRIHWKWKNVGLKLISQIVSIGLPQALGQMAMSLAILLMNRIIIDVNSNAMTSFTLVGRFQQITIMPAFALSSALITIVGQNAGRGLLTRVRQAWKTAISAAIASSFLLASLLILLAPWIYSFFTTVDEVLYFAIRQTRLLQYTLMVAVISIMGRSLFQAIGRPLPALFLTILRTLLITYPLALILVYLFGMEIDGFYLAIGTGNVVSGLLAAMIISRTLRRLVSGKMKVVSIKK